MKIYACALTVLLCSARTSSGDLEPCPLVLSEGIPSIHTQLTASSEACVHTNRADRELETRSANSTEDYRAAFKRACEKRPIFTECLDDVRTAADRCLVGIERTQFLLALGLKLTVYDVECLKDGERSALIHEEQRKYYSSQYPVPLDVVQDCRLTAHARVLLSIEDYATPNYRTTYEYRILRDAIDCLEKHRGGEYDTLVDAGVAQWADILDRMKCVDTQTGDEIILCKTIIDVPPESTVIPVELVH